MVGRSLGLLLQPLRRLPRRPRPENEITIAIVGRRIERLVFGVEDVPRVDRVAHGTIDESEALPNENHGRMKGMRQAGQLGSVEVPVPPLLGEDTRAVDRASQEVKLARHADLTPTLEAQLLLPLSSTFIVSRRSCALR